MQALDKLPDYPILRQVQDALWGVAEVRGAAVMVGAGFSRFAQLASETARLPPLWSDLRREMVQRLYGDEDPGRDALKLADEYAVALGRHALDALIRELVRDEQWTPGVLHRRLLALPWADVLTTNWDTLLERTPLLDPDRAYEAVRVAPDIARTRPPRIVKLHGSLPSHTPFILTEEDFRTYPRRFAPFVNLAQQVLLESELCLLGFSGDDPNFLQWSGWVRDHLGASARRIRLVGALDLTPSRRQVLEHHNVSPIDLGPLVASPDLEPGERHRRAAEIFLEALWAAKPKPSHLWTRHDRDARSGLDALEAEERLKRLTELWRADREGYPRWLVAPPVERLLLRHETAEVYGLLRRDLPAVPASVRASALQELVWRHETALWPLGSFAEEAVAAALDSPASGLSRSEQGRLMASLVRSARRRRDWGAFDKWTERLEALGRPEASLASTYERALRARDDLDHAALATLVGQLVGEDPVWSLRRAMLLSDLGEPRRAADALQVALEEIRGRRARERDSLPLLSREAWAAWLMRGASFELEKPPERSHNVDEDDWPAKYKIERCDPWDELRHFDESIEEAFERRRQEAHAVQPLYDAGAYSTSRTISFEGDGFLSPLDELVCFTEHAGVPQRVGFFDALGSRFARALEVERHRSPRNVWLAARSLPNRTEDLVDRYFGRVEVARLPDDLVQDLVQHLRRAIDYGRHQFARDEGTTWINRTCTNVELLSRLAVRLSPAEATSLFVWGARDLARDPAWSHWWLFEPLDKLLKRALEAVPPDERSTLALAAVQLPLPAEQGHAVQRQEQAWPELADVLKPGDFSARDRSQAWSRRVAELIEFARTGENLDRTRAIQRLLLMHQGGALAAEERTAFAQAVWGRREAGEGLPADTDLHAHVFLLIPEPEPGLARSVFERTVVGPLTGGQVSEPGLIAVYGAAWERTGCTDTWSLTAAAALAIFDACLAWTPQQVDERDPRGRAAHVNEGIVANLGPCLALAVLPILSADDLGPERIERWIRSLEAEDMPSLLQTAAEVIRLAPEHEARVVSLVRRRLANRHSLTVFNALAAIERLVRANQRGASPFPAVLASDVAAVCATRREPGLPNALGCARVTLEADLLAVEDQSRVIDGLEFLLAETAYDAWDVTDPRTMSLSLIRRECVLLAQALSLRGRTEEAVRGWISASAGDPSPEVRFAGHGGGSSQGDVVGSEP